MKNFIKYFHYLSYLQYPFLALGLFYSYKPIIMGMENMFHDYNLSLFFFGIAMSFSSLANIKKRTKIGDKIYGHPKRAKWWLIYMITLTITIFALATKTMFITKDERFQEFGVGLFVLGIGVIGLLRMSLEAIEFYQNEVEDFPKDDSK
ncbi:MAG: hypothetical protein AB8G11_12960 [Saprospiraceae bacterium]